MRRLRAARAAVAGEAQARADYWRDVAKAADAEVAAYAAAGLYDTLMCIGTRQRAAWARLMVALWEVLC